MPLDKQMSTAQMFEQVEQKYGEVMLPHLEPVLGNYRHAVKGDYNQFIRTNMGEVALDPFKMLHPDQGADATMELTQFTVLTDTGIAAVEDGEVQLQDIYNGQIVHNQFGLFYSHTLG